MSDPLWPHGFQHTRLLCPSLSPGVCSNSRPLSRRSHPLISSSVTCFSSCPQSFLESESSPVSQLFASGGQSVGASATALVLLWIFSVLISFRVDQLDLLVVQGTLKSLLQHHNICWKNIIGCNTSLSNFKRTEIIQIMFSYHSGMIVQLNKRRKIGELTNTWK